MNKYDENGNWTASAHSFDDPAQVEGLLNAILTDCANGAMGQSWNFHNGNASIYHIGFELGEDVAKELEDVYRFRNLSIYSDCTNTIAYLEKLFAEEPADNSK